MLINSNKIGAQSPDQRPSIGKESSLLEQEQDVKTVWPKLHTHTRAYVYINIPYMYALIYISI